jgi:hypothetical protein
MMCSAPRCKNRAEVIVRELPLCHGHYTLLRLHLDLRQIALRQFDGDLRDLLRDRCHFAEALRS